MIKTRKIVLFLVFIFISSKLVHSQAIDPALIEKAKAAGVTQEQIDDAMSKKDGTNTTQQKSNSVGVTKEEVKEREVPKVITPKEPSVEILPGIFGREIFSTRNLTFAPDYNMPTPAGYILAARDEVVIDVWGASEFNATLKISPDGNINLPGVGLVYLNGLSVDQAELKIKSSLKKIMSGIGSQTQVKVSLGQIRSIKVNIVGEVAMPGTYTLPSLATLFNALYSAGGVNEIGSLRSIRVFRNNKEVATLDVYDFLLNGKYDTNIRLEDNDMIIVSPYQNLVSIGGKVKRERTFELTKEETLGKLVGYAGGTTGGAYSENIQVRRKSGRMYQIFTINSSDFESFKMSDGDSVMVSPIISEYSNRLIIKGAVWNPGEYELSERTDSLSKLIKIAEGLKGNEFATRGQISRRKKDFTYEVLSFNPRNIVNGNGDILLMPNDEVFIPSIFDLREEYYLIIKGEVNRPDTIKFQENMTIEDAILQCGGIMTSASVEKIEVARRIQDQLNYTPRTAEIFSFNILKGLESSPDASGFTLKPFDEIIVRSSPGYKVQTSVYIKGEILYEGEYVLASDGERLSDLIKKAGGLTPAAYIEGASLQRQYSEEERNKLESMMRIASEGRPKDTISLKTLYPDEYYSVGINLKSALDKSGGHNDVILMAGDQIYVPKYKGVVKVSGAVLYPNALTVEQGKGLKSYLYKSGGYQNGARKRPYVVYMNGDVASTKSIMGIKKYPKIEPGSEIIVPMKIAKTGGAKGPEILAIATMSVSLASVIAMLLSVL